MEAEKYHIYLSTKERNEIVASLINLKTAFCLAIGLKNKYFHDRLENESVRYIAIWLWHITVRFCTVTRFCQLFKGGDLRSKYYP